MSWHTFPHVPEEGAHIMVLLKGSNAGNYFEMTVIEGESLAHLEKWCYYQDYKESLERRLTNEKYI